MTDNLEVGMKLHAMYSDGEFYPALVDAISTSKNRSKAPVKVSFVGYDEAPVWKSLDNLKSKKIPKSAQTPEPKAKPKAKVKAKAAPEPKAKAKAKAKVKAKAEKPKRAPPSIKLSYFGIEGVAEKIRLALVIGKVEFEDDRVDFARWAEMKPTTKYGQLPVMQIGDGEPFAQSGAMLRYCGRMARLCPPQSTLKIEEAIGLEEDIGRTVAPSLYMGMKPQQYGYPEDMPKEERTKIQLKLRATIIEKPDGPLFQQLGWMEKLLGEGPFMCGKSVTIADCQVIPRLRHLKKGILDGIPATILDDFPKLVEYYDRFHEIPEVKAYYEKLAAAK